MSKEIWKFIDGLENHEISNMGRVRYKGVHIKFQATTKKGYKEVRIKDKGNTHRFVVHRLVAKYFVDGYREDLTVDHIDEDKANNNYANLRWISRYENWRRSNTGVKHWKNKLSPSDVSDIKTRYASGETQKSIGLSYNVDSSVISRVVNDKLSYLLTS